MDHNKITEKKNKLIEEQRKKDEAKARKEKKERALAGTLFGTSVSNSVSASAIRASNNNPFRSGGTITESLGMQ
jgi:hypothetical protein